MTGKKRERYMRSIAVTALAVMVMLQCGCARGIYETLSRDTSDPREDSGDVESFKESNMITMRWEADSGADVFMVERAVDAQILDFKKVYEGEALEYVDRGLIDGQRYIYRLGKRRGRKVFGPYEERFGVSSLITEDEYEPNDEREEAILLSTNPLDMNLYFYESEGGHRIYDEDWFCIDVPPLRRASITIRDSEVEGDNVPTHFRMYEDKRGYSDVRQVIPLWLRNTEREAKRIYFKIYPNEDKYRGTTGGAIIRYTIEMGSIVGLDS